MPGDAPLPAVARGTRLAAAELGVALVVAVGVVAAMGAVTNRLAPTAYFFDEQVYLKMAVEGVTAVKPVTAPFAYRPGTTALVGAVARLAGVPPARAYGGLAAVALPLMLLALYVLARRAGADRWRAGVATLLVGVSYSAVKRLVFDPIGPDALGLLAVVVAVGLAQGRRYGLLAVVVTLGVTAREFVLVPAVAAAVAARGELGLRPWRRLRPLLPLAGGILGLVAVRLAVRVDASTQNLDPLHPATWGHALQVFDGRWLVNAVGAAAAFLWPLLCGGGGSRAPAAAAAPGASAPAPLPAWLAPYGLALFAVTLLAGTNFTWFAAYYAPLLVVAWALRAPAGPRWLDVALLLLALVVNRTLEPIPPPRDFASYVGFMAFAGKSLDANTAVRVLVIGAAVLAHRGLAALAQADRAAAR